MSRIVAYERVSTARQGASGLGIEAQRQAIEAYAGQRNATILARFIVDNANGIVDQPRPLRFKGYTNFDDYVPLTTWTKIAINNTEYNDQGAFDVANSRFVAPGAGTYHFGSSVLASQS
jgi:hypothetical protein